MKRNAAIQQKAESEARRLLQVIGPMHEAGTTLEGIAAALENMEVPTSRGGRWTAKQVSRILQRGTGA